MPIHLNLRRIPPLVALVTALLATRAAVAEQAEQQFKEAYYLQTHENDPAAAAALYQKVAADESAPAALRAEAKTRLGQCQEDQVAANLAQLLPPETVAYVQITEPGKHIAQVLRMVGLARDPSAAEQPGASPSDAAHGTPLPGGLALPANFSLSPTLIRALEKSRSAAVAITGVDREGIPSGVAVVHLDDLDLIHSLIETSVQVLPRGEAVAGFPLYTVENRVWIAPTHRMVVVSDSRERVAQTIGRLTDPSAADSLAKQPAFSRLDADRKGTLAFAFVDGRRALALAGPHFRGQEAAMANVFLDLQNLESVSAGFGTTETGIQASIKVAMREGHRNLAYGMIRTSPLSKRSLANVPAGAAAVAVVGLNPPEKSGGAAGDQTGGGVTAMDIGREIFANVEEVSLFVLPSASGEGRNIMPDVGMVAAVKDPAKSEALWDQLLSLAALAGPQVAGPPQEIEIEGQKARQYQFAGAPPIVIVRLADRGMAAGTRGAVTAALHAEKSKNSITGDDQFQPLLERLKAETSKALLVHVGRVVELAAAAERRHGDEIRQIASLLGDLRFMVATHEAPNEFAVQASVSGLPNVPKIVHAALGGQFGDRAERRVIVRSREATIAQPPRAVQSPPAPPPAPPAPRKPVEATPARP